MLVHSIGWGQIYAPGETSVQRYIGLDKWTPYNPAWLYQDSATDIVRYAVETGQTEDTFKRPFDPGKSNNMFFSTAGAKRLPGRQLFRGSFTYQKQVLDDISWIQNSRPYIGIPFLIADTSTSGSSLNGLHWHIDYADIILKEKLSWGLTLFYNVSQQYKTVFPRPKVDRRDIHLAAGLGAVLGSYCRTGLKVGYFDYQEQIITSRYSMDQWKTPVFYKIRGLDTPVIFEGKTSEERLNNLSGYTIDIDFTLRYPSGLSADFNGGIEDASATVVDGGNYPVDQGKWWSDRYYFSTSLSIPVKSSAVLFFLSGELAPQSARHPDLNIEVYQSRWKFLRGGVSAALQPLPQWELTAGVTGGSESYKRVDLYNGILDYHHGSFVGISIGSKHRLSEKLTGSLLFAGEQYLPGQSIVYTERTGFFYDAITKVESDYYGAQKVFYTLDTNLDWQLTPDTRLIVNGKGYLLAPGHDADQVSGTGTGWYFGLAVERAYR
ncbi:MAG: hypothetical protein KAU50_03670 [Candidatus Marinimicrobia bacterium]|nr:hypothetical protein [Candidatus Neomarinimicrobiota bacterium]